MRILALGLASAALAVGAACGGSVVFVEDGDGGGGSGGSTTTSTKSSATSSKASNATSTSSTTSVAVTTSASVTTATGGQFCQIGETPPDCQTCVQNAIDGPCSEAFQNCFGDLDCENYGTCVFDCNSNTGCCQSCATQFPPQAVAAYHTVLSCVFCSVCGGPECAGVVPGLCSE
jgi:hypothetical protein